MEQQTYTLQDAIRDAKYPDDAISPPLTDDEVDKLVKLLTVQCREETKDLVHRRLRNQLSMLRSYGIYGRVEIRPRVEYCAGQSYPDEIRRVRELIKEG